MDEIEELLTSMESLEESEQEALRWVGKRFNRETGHKFSDEYSALRAFNEKIEELISLYEDNNYIEFLGLLEEVESKREVVNERLIAKLENIDSKSLAESTNCSADKFSNAVEKMIQNEEKMESIAKEIEDRAEKKLYRKALDEAKNIIHDKRIQVHFRKEALSNYHKHAYQEIYLSENEKEPTNKVGKECAGYFSYELRKRKNKSRILILTEYNAIEEGYKRRSEDEYALKEEKREELRQKDIVTAHVHPPGGQKSHSGADSTEKSANFDEIPHPSNGIGILAIPESKKLIWTIAQSPSARSKAWRNHHIEIEDGKAPRASLKKYNKAIVKALAFSKISDEINSWEKFDYFERIDEFPERLSKHLGYAYQNDLRENQWIKYLENQTY